MIKSDFYKDSILEKNNENNQNKILENFCLSLNFDPNENFQMNLNSSKISKDKFFVLNENLKNNINNYSIKKENNLDLNTKILGIF
jgi:hypothetical protein